MHSKFDGGLLSVVTVLLLGAALTGCSSTPKLALGESCRQIKAARDPAFAAMRSGVHGAALADDVRRSGEKLVALSDSVADPLQDAAGTMGHGLISMANDPKTFGSSEAHSRLLAADRDLSTVCATYW
jgi:hypothetical protein